MATKDEEKKKTEVAVASQGGNLPAASDLDIFADAGLGNENVGQQDITIPRLKVAQALSPEIKKQKAEYIEGAEEGSVFNSATRELYQTPLVVVPVAYVRRHLEWVPREKGGGLVNADHTESILEECTRTEKGDWVLPNGNEIVVTPEHFVIVVKADGSYEQAVLSMSGSKAKISRNWNTAIRNVKIRNPATGLMVNPARFYMSYKLDTVMETNDQGDFFNWKISTNLPTIEIPDIGVEVYREARAFHELIKSGIVKAEVENPAEGKPDAGPVDNNNAF